MKIAICDDNTTDTKNIIDLMHSSDFYYDDFEICVFSSGLDLVSQYEIGYRTDLVFLDIEMPHTDGINIADTIRKVDKETIIIFISSHTERVFDTFNCETFNFLVKPIKSEKFNDVFSRAIKKYELNNSYYIIKWKNQNTRIETKSIKYVECYKKHMIFYTFNGVFEMRSTLTDTLKKLEPFGFIQTHQGYIVNMNLIKRFEGADVILVDNTRVMISARKKNEVLLKYSEFVERWK